MPWPTSLVVKNGSKMRCSRPSLIPGAGVLHPDFEQLAALNARHPHLADVAFANCIAGVADEVDEDLFQLNGIASRT